MKMQKMLALLLASLIVMLLCSGVALAKPVGNCCLPGAEGGACVCDHRGTQEACENSGGIWVGNDGCVYGKTEVCSHYCSQGGKCVPEMSTIALLATGLICMVGYLRLRRKEE